MFRVDIRNSVKSGIWNFLSRSESGIKAINERKCKNVPNSLWMSVNAKVSVSVSVIVIVGMSYSMTVTMIVNRGVSVKVGVSELMANYKLNVIEVTT